MRDPQLLQPVNKQRRQQPQGPSSRRRIRHAFAIATLMLVSCHQNGDNGSTGQPGVVVSAFSNARTRTTWPMTMKLSDGSSRQPSTSSPSRDLSSRSSQRGVGPPAGSPLAMICQDQEEFELNVGHAMDTLRSDYPDILTAKPGRFSSLFYQSTCSDKRSTNASEIECHCSEENYGFLGKN
jgi:hypothetical protein